MKLMSQRLNKEEKLRQDHFERLNRIKNDSEKKTGLVSSILTTNIQELAKIDQQNFIKAVEEKSKAQAELDNAAKERQRKKNAEVSQSNLQQVNHKNELKRQNLAEEQNVVNILASKLKEIDDNEK